MSRPRKCDCELHSCRICRNRVNNTASKQRRKDEWERELKKSQTMARPIGIQQIMQAPADKLAGLINEMIKRR